MSKKIKQFRWYGDNDSRNSPANISDEEKVSIDNYVDGSVFSDVYPIAQLGIQGPPGLRFYLNGSVNPIVIGASGIYDLEVKKGARITGLEFDKQSLQRVASYNYLIVDILYGEED